MKIERINKIKTHRIFRDFTWPNGLSDFCTYNLIYGWNGSGKTTLSNLFRYLQLKQSIPRIDGEVQFKIDGNTVSGDALAGATLPPVRVFNRDSVDRNVFEVPNHQLPPVYFLGEDSVEKEKRIVALKARFERVDALKSTWERKKTSAEGDLEKFCTDRAREIKNLLTASGGGPYNNYDARLFKQTVNRLSGANPPAKLLTDEERERHLATKESTTMEKVQPPSIQFPDFTEITSQVQAALKRSVLSTVIPELVANPDIATWVGKGLDLHTGQHETDKCRFCDQPIPPKRLEQLEAHFNDQFKQFKNDISKLIATVDNAKSLMTTLNLPDKRLLYPHVREEFDKNVKTLAQKFTLVSLYFDALHRALVAKKDEPFKKLDVLNFLSGNAAMDEKPGILEMIFHAFATAAATINAMIGKDAYENIKNLINEHNKHTDNFLQELNASRKALEEDAVVTALQDYQNRQQAIIVAASKQTKADRIAQAIREKVSTLELAIQKHQKPAEELNKEMASYLGRDELHFEVQKSGYTITRNGQPAMHLSEGERTAIAFMYFLKTLEDSGFDMKNGVIVIDDPVSSLDANSLYSAFGFMKARTCNANQLFVLTHNFTFFRQVRNWFQKRPNQDKKQRPAQFYMLTSKTEDSARTAILESLDPLLRDYESEYQYLFKYVYDVANKQGTQGSIETYYGLPNIARRLLEAFLAFRLPNMLPDKLYQKLELVKFDPAKKARILRFLHTHSHFDQIGDPEHDLSVLSETPAILQDLLALIKESDPEHYAGMTSLLQPPAGQQTGGQP